MAHKGLLINYNYCTGCMTCQLACQMEHDLPDNKNGLNISQIGPFEVKNNHWEYDYIPEPTDFCDLCEQRTSEGREPSCVKHCQAACIDWGDVTDLAAKIDSPKYVLYSIV